MASKPVAIGFLQPHMAKLEQVYGEPLDLTPAQYRLLHLAFVHHTCELVNSTYGHSAHPWGNHYYQLELIGDSALNLATVTYLLKHFPNNEHTKMLITFVQNSNLRKLSLKLGFDKMLQHNIQVSVEGTKIIADIFESFVGFIYLNFGMKDVERFLEPLLNEHYRGSPRQPTEPYKLSTYVPGKDRTMEPNYKGQLLEKYGNSGYKFDIISREGPPHDPVFTAQISKKGVPICTAKGKNKKIAEQECAHKLLLMLGPD